MILMQVYTKKLIDDYTHAGYDVNDHNNISDWLLKQMFMKKITEEDIDNIFALFATSIYHIDMFNGLYPCHYIPNNTRLYVHLVLYVSFLSALQDTHTTQI